MLGPIPFEVPAKFAGDLASGSLIRAGALLKDAGSGKIVAHLQETGLTQNLLNSAVSSPFSPLQVLNTPSSFVANAQLAQLKTMMTSLQMFQFINLGATVAGIGVSALGFALMNKKLNGLSSQLKSFESRVEARFDELHQRELRGHYSKIQGLFKQAEQAHYLTTSTEEWRRIANILAEESSYFQGELEYLMQNETFDYELFTSFIRSYALSNSGRIECWMLANELEGAQRVSLDVSQEYNSLFDPIIPIKLAHKSLNLIEKSDEGLLNQKLLKMRDLVGSLRDIQDVSASKPYLIETLIEREINGKEYMEAITNEKDQPLLLLESA